MKTNLRSWASWLGQTRITLVLALLIFFTFLHSCICWLLEAQCNAKMARITANSQTRQVPQSLKDYRRKLSSRQENAAPYYQAAWSLMEAQEKGSLVLRLCKTVDGRSRFVFDRPADLQGADLLLKSHSECFELLSRAHSKPECSFELKYERGFQTPIPEFPKMRGLVNLIALRAAAAKAHGDWLLWNQSMVQGLRFVRRLEPDACVIGQLIRLSLLNTMISGADGVPGDMVSSEVKTEARMLNTELPIMWNLAVQGEYLNAMEAFDSLESGKTNFAVLKSFVGDFGYGYDGLLETILESIYVAGGRPLILADKLSYLQYSEGANAPATSIAEAHGFLPVGFSAALEISIGRARKKQLEAIEHLQVLLK